MHVTLSKFHNRLLSIFCSLKVLIISLFITYVKFYITSAHSKIPNGLNFLFRLSFFPEEKGIVFDSLRPYPKLSCTHATEVCSNPTASASFVLDYRSKQYI